MVAHERKLTPNRSARDFFGSELRRYRTKHNMSLAELGTAVAYGKSTLSRVEVADSPAPPDLPAALDSVLQADGHFSRLYELVLSEAHPDRYKRRMELEQRALCLNQFAGQLVPGIVQTRAYAEAVISCRVEGGTPERIAELIDARLNRQSLLHTEPRPFLSIVLDEAVVRRPIAGREGMLEQLSVLRSMVDTEQSLVQVVPNSFGAHPLIGGTLSLMTLENGKTVAYEESIASGNLYEDRERVLPRQRAYDRMRAYALSPTDTAALLTSVMEEISP